MTTTKDRARQVIKSLGLTMQARFIPWDKSRSNGDKTPSLNWAVTIEKDGKPVIKTDYTAGSGHCPSYKQGDETIQQQQIIARECARGITERGRKIDLDIVDVMYNIVSDTDAIDCGSFEEWADNCGYDTDSRKAEAIYKSCVEMGLALRSKIGDEGIQLLRDAMQDM